MAVKKSPPMRVVGKGHGTTGDKHAPKLPPIKGPGTGDHSLLAKKR